MPLTVNASAATSRRPSGSPRAKAAPVTPTTGVSNVPMEAAEAGSRLSAANQARYQRQSGPAAM